MSILFSAFAWVPEFAQGYVKDIRPRWAMDGAGLDYEVVPVAGEEADGADSIAGATPSYTGYVP